MKPLKHSKYRNTGLLFELLSRQLTSDILTENVQESVAGNLIKKYFRKDTELSKELELYQSIVKSNFVNENKINALLEAVLKARTRLSNSNLRRQKYNLVKDLQEHYEINNFFNSRVPEYKTYASIYKLFENKESDNPTAFVNVRYTIIESKTNKKENTPTEKPITEDIKDKDIGALAYKILVEKFNKKYKGLAKEQKDLLNKYINNVSNTTELKDYIKQESVKLENTLEKLNPQIKDQVTNIKINETKNLLKELRKGKTVKDNEIVSLMNYYELVKEIKKVTK